MLVICTECPHPNQFQCPPLAGIGLLGNGFMPFFRRFFAGFQQAPAGHPQIRQRCVACRPPICGLTHAAGATAAPRPLRRPQACAHADEAHAHLSPVLPALHQCSPPAAQDLPVPAQEQSRDACQPSLRYRPNAQRVDVSVCSGGLVQPQGLGLATVQYYGRTVLRGCRARGYCPLGNARHLQHRSGQPNSPAEPLPHS